MSTNCNAGRAPVNGGALSGPTLARIVEELFERVDFGKDSIDGLRETVRDQHVALEAANRERDAAIHVAATNAISGGLYAAEAQRAERHLRIAESALVELQGIIGGAYVLATGLGSIHDIATTLAPYVPATTPPADPRLDPAAAAGVDVQAEGVAYSLPSGFIVVGEMLPPGRYEGREHPGGFFEIDPAALPRDVFRSIFGLDRQPDELPDPATAQRQLGEIGATMGSAAKPTPEPEPDFSEPDFSEEENFILEAAEQHGFNLVDDAGLYTASAKTVIALVKAARAQGRRDVTAGVQALARARNTLSQARGESPPDVLSAARERAISGTIKAIDDALVGLMK